MNSRVTRYVIAALAAVILLVGAFAGGVVVGWVIPHQEGQLASLGDWQLNTSEKQGTPTDLEALFKPFWQTWRIVHDEYVDQPVDDVELMRGAIRGMLAALGDQHTSYMDPEQYQQQNSALVGDYEGIGAWVDATQEYLTIISPMPGGPAEAAGIKAGDSIIAVDGEDMTGVDGNLVLKKVLGPAGSTVTLTLRREGIEQPLDVTVKRARIVVPSVEGKMLDQQVAYIQLSTFGDKTAQDLRKTLTDLMSQKPVGIILDLRNNGGGYLDTAIDVMSEFIEQGTIMIEEYGDGTRQTYDAKGNGLATKIPLVVLVNEGSASASEITAGAIQDLGRGKLVGVTTYGKGSVQNWIPLNNETGAVRVTVARWLTPNGRQIHKVGLIPDVMVPLTEEDLKAGKDPQLDRAIELLIAEISK